MRSRQLLTVALRWGPIAGLLVILLFIRLLGDRFWGALPLLYGPRWLTLILVPIPVLTLRGATKPVLIAIASSVVLGLLIVDFRVPVAGILPIGTEGTTLTVVEWNAHGGGNSAQAELAVNYLHDLKPDLMIVAECGNELVASMEDLSDFEVQRAASVCIASRWPVLDWKPRNPSDFWAVGGSGIANRMIISVAGREVVVGGVHLETPRDAIEDFTSLALRSFIKTDAANRVLRDQESRAARSWIFDEDETRPVIVAGDFNLPVESAIYRRWWGDLTNAINSRGFGLEWTKETRLFGVRIDHVLVGNGMRVKGALVGNAMGSDHRPVIADLILPLPN